MYKHEHFPTVYDIEPMRENKEENQTYFSKQRFIGIIDRCWLLEKQDCCLKAYEVNPVLVAQYFENENVFFFWRD